MKRFLVENLRKGTTLKVMLHSPPYENENILYKTGYKEKDCKITELSESSSLQLSDYKSIDNEFDEAENSLMGKKIPKKKKIKKVKGKK
tara:strand:+ start:500 stop:766 length:267 start_codon:yes stop_codon:yes gene_type:complete